MADLKAVYEQLVNYLCENVAINSMISKPVTYVELTRIKNIVADFLKEIPGGEKMELEVILAFGGNVEIKITPPIEYIHFALKTQY